MSRAISRSGHRVLSPRAALRRVFGGMAVFVALPLLGLGAYLIEDQFENPVSSHPAGLVIAAVLITVALFLLSYVIWPGVGRKDEADLAMIEEPARPTRTIEITMGVPLAVRQEPSDLPIQRGDYRTAVTANSPVVAQARGIAGK